ncbi:hypothetical protein D3C78_941880 [compost metagenome]
MGPQLPSRLSQAARLPAPVRHSPGAAADRHCHPGGDRRHAGEVRHRRGGCDHHRFLPAQPEPAGGAGAGRRQAAPAGGMAGRAGGAAEHRLCHPAEDRRAGRRASRAVWHSCLRLPRWHGARGTRVDPAPVHGGAAELHRRHHRLRHGHRQERYPQRRAFRPAEIRRELQPGNRPRRPRRQALGLPGAGQPRQPQRAAELRLRRHPRARRHPLRARRAGRCAGWRVGADAQRALRAEQYPPAAAEDAAGAAGAARHHRPALRLLRRVPLQVPART